MKNEMKRGPGRPKLPGEKAKSVGIKFRITPEEEKKICENASKRNMSKSEYLRNLVRSDI